MKPFILSFLFLLPAATAQAQSDLQKQIDALPKTGGTLQLTSKQYFIQGPLSLRNRRGVRIVGEGVGTELAFVVADGQALLIDMTGASACELAHVRVTSRVAKPRIGLLLARNETGASAGEHRFINVRWETPALLANVASFGSEVNLYEHCFFDNTAPGGANFLTGREVAPGVASPFGTVYGGSNLCHLFQNCFFGMYARTGAEINVVLQSGTGYFTMNGGGLSNKSLDRTKSNQGGLVGFLLGGPDQELPCEHIVISSVEAETHGTKNAIQIVGRVRGLRLQNTLLQSLETAIRITGTLEDSVIEQNSLDAGMAQYEWQDGPLRSLVVVDGGKVLNSRLDFRYRRLGPLARDQSPNDSGSRPAVALSILGDASKASFIRNEVIVQRDGDCFFAPELKSLEPENTIILLREFPQRLP